MNTLEVIDRFDVAEVLVHHLKYRKETRWPGGQTRMDEAEVAAKIGCFVEIRRDPKTREIQISTRPYEQIIAGDRTKP